MPNTKLLAALLVPLGLAARVAPAAAQSFGPPSSVAPGASDSAACDVSGTYTGTWGATSLTQTGDHVTGTYSYDDGRIDGTLTGNTIHFTWTEDSGSGKGVFTRMSDGSLQGTWGYGDDESNGGAWQLASSKNGGAGPGGWSWGIRFPWDVTFTPNNITMGAVGVGLDVGKQLTNSRWYLGGMAEWELEVAMEAPTTSDGEAPAAYSRERVGGEARYYFHDGVAGVSVNDGPVEAVPRHDWIGFRAGAESYDSFSQVGEFADITLGWDAQLGGTQLGMYLTGGVSREPSSVFAGTPANTDTTYDANPANAPAPPAEYTSPYIAMGIHLQF